MKISHASFLPAVFVSAAFGCGGGAREPAQVRIGLLAILSDVPAETSGLPSIRGAEMAVEEANAGGGIDLGGVRHAVVLLVESYEDRPDSATSVARALINQRRIDALVGPQFSRHAIPVALVAENARVPMLSPMSSNPGTTEGKRFVFRLAFLDEAQARVMARFASSELSAKTAAVLYDVSTAYGRSLAATFRRTFEEGGGEVVAFESYTRDGPLEYGEQLERIKQTRPEILYLPNDSLRVEAQLTQARKHGIDAIILGGDTWDMQRLSPLQEADGAYVAHQWHPDLDTPESRRFVERYEDAHGETPRVTAAMTYDAVRLVLQAIEAAGSRAPEAVREALANAGTFTGAAGTIRFQGGPDPERSVVVSQIRDGGTRLHRVFDPEPPP